MRITITDLRTLYVAYVKACENAGFATTGYELREGSVTYGQAYRSYQDGHGTPGADMNGYLGSTIREAYRALEVAISVLWDVREMNR